MKFYLNTFMAIIINIEGNGNLIKHDKSYKLYNLPNTKNFCP